MKLLGALIIIVAFGLIGITIGRNYRRRPEELRNLQGALQILETEIVYGATPLPVAFDRIGKIFNNQVGKIFVSAKEFLHSENGISIEQAWAKALEQQFQNTSLSKRDFEVVKVLGSSLGISDRTDQTKHLRLALEKLKNEEKGARDESAKYAKTFNYLGFLCGLTLVILIL